MAIAYTLDFFLNFFVTRSHKIACIAAEITNLFPAQGYMPKITVILSNFAEI
jgi:hypothetical protein